jgi:integrase
VATLRKDPNGKGKGEWWVDHTYRLPDGTRHRERFKLKAATEAEALVLFEAWKADEGKEKPQYEQRKRAKAPVLKQDPTIAELCRWYVEDLQVARGDGYETLRNNRRYFDHFVAYLKGEGVDRVSQLTARPYLVTSYVKELRQITYGKNPKRIDETTVETRIKKIRAVFRNALEQKLIKEAPVTAWPKFKRKTPSLDTIDTAAFLSAVDRMKEKNPRWANAIVYLAHIGCRPIDVAELTWEAVNLDERTVAFRQSKTADPVKIPLSDDAYEALLSEHRRAVQSPFVFTNPKGRPIRDPNLLTKVLQYHCGIDCRDFRQYTVTMLAELGYDNETIGLVTGHKSEVVEVYKKRRMERAKRALDDLSAHRITYGKQQTEAPEAPEHLSD